MNRYKRPGAMRARPIRALLIRASVGAHKPIRARIRARPIGPSLQGPREAHKKVDDSMTTMLLMYFQADMK